MRAGEAAVAASVSVKALKYYEELGLVRPARLANGYRDYSSEDVQIAAEIRGLMALGLSPREARPFVECLRDGHAAGDDCPESLAAYQVKIRQLDALIARLAGTRRDLVRQMHAAARRGFDPRLSREEPPEMLPLPDALPDDLPAPVDDGAAAHLPGRTMPALAFPATDGTEVRLDAVSPGRWVLFLYPLTGEPGADVPQGWNEIPGARGCSQEACGFRDLLSALEAEGVQRVVALSTDKAEYQRDLVRRLHLPYPMVSDPGLTLARELGLPTFEAEGMTLYRRLTLIVRGDVVEHVFYPVFPPDTHAAEVVEWLRRSGG